MASVVGMTESYHRFGSTAETCAVRCDGKLLNQNRFGSGFGLPVYFCIKASFRPKNSAWPSQKPTLPRQSWLPSLLFPPLLSLLLALRFCRSCRDATSSQTLASDGLAGFQL